VLQVRVLEVSRVLQTESKRPVHADMGGPDQSIGHGQQSLCGDGIEQKQQRHGQRVNRIVNRGANADVPLISQHRKVGREKQYGEEQPACMRLPVEKYAERKNDAAFHAKQNTRF
jgi:hypothetical protein